MDREELLKLHAALGAVLALPESIHELLAKWLETAKPNGHDPHPPAVPSPTLKAASKPHTAKRYDNPAHARAAERRLLAAMREHPGLSAASLAKVVGAGLSTTKERLRRMDGQELIEKAPDGCWRVKAEEPRPPTQEEEPGPQQPSPN
jgi:hypothetical protein